MLILKMCFFGTGGGVKIFCQSLFIQGQGGIFLRIPRFFNGEKFASFGWSREEFTICHHIIFINRGETHLNLLK